MANLNRSVTAHNLSPPPTNKPITEPKIPSLSSINFSLYSSQFFTRSYPSLNSTFLTKRKPYYTLAKSVTEDRDVITSQTSNSSNKKEEARIGGDVEGENPVRFDGSEDSDKFVGRAINATIVLTVGSLAITKLLTIDHEYWQGWTLYEVLRYAPEHNWVAYEEALKTHPVLAKMVISGVVYSVGDWIAQCYEGKSLFEFDRTRLFRSGLVGFSLHGFLSHYYYQFCEALFPSKEWWVVLAKVAFDQTVWAAVWNSIYYVALGFLRLESPGVIFNELKLSFLPLLTAGWKLWPFAHLITYGVIPVEQRLLWVDCVELIWVTILSTYSNEKSESRISEASLEEMSSSSSNNAPESRGIIGVNDLRNLLLEKLLRPRIE